MKYIYGAFIALTIIIGSILLINRQGTMNSSPETDNTTETVQQKVILRESVEPGLASATFAGGCFWCTESAFQEQPGVKNAISGYAGGSEYNPTYEAVYKETTSHREAVRVFYDSSEISYEELLDIFWKSIDPTDDEGQFIDRGFSYTTAIFYENEDQKIHAEISKTNLENSNVFTDPIVTPILEFTTFYEAELYHQDFYLKSSDRYKNYASNSGRVEFKAQVWQEIKKSEY